MVSILSLSDLLFVPNGYSHRDYNAVFELAICLGVANQNPGTLAYQYFRAVLVILRGKRSCRVVFSHKAKAKTLSSLAVFFGVFLHSHTNLGSGCTCRSLHFRGIDRGTSNHIRNQFAKIGGVF